MPSPVGLIHSDEANDKVRIGVTLTCVIAFDIPSRYATGSAPDASVNKVIAAERLAAAKRPE